MKKNGAYLDFLPYVAFASLVFGLKLWVIHLFGNATPYWDQWDSEWDNLYKPYLEGTLVWKDLFILVNEHRVLMTRLLNLVELEINGLWNPLFQMVINAGLHIGVIIFLVNRLALVIGRKYGPALLVFAAILFGVPYAYENTLSGFQSMFYFVFLFSVLSIWLTTMKTPLSAGWWLGLGGGLLAFVSLASGIFALAASAALGFVFFVSGIRRGAKQLLAVVILASLFILGAIATPTLAHHATLKASSVREFVDALVATLAWPAELGYLSALLRNLPGLILITQMLKLRPPATDRRWFLVALIVWTFGAAVGVAYGRAAGSTASRYLDIFVISILVNFACLLALAGRGAPAGLTKGLTKDLTKGLTDGPSKRWSKLLSLMWVIAIFAALGIRAVNKLPQELAEKRDTGQAQEVNTRNYLATGDAGHLHNKPFLHVPYPDPDRLISLLASPHLRAILPSNLTAPAANSELSLDPVTTSIKVKFGRLDGLCTLLLENFGFFIGLGLCISLGLVVYSVGGRKRTT